MLVFGDMCHVELIRAQTETYKGKSQVPKTSLSPFTAPQVASMTTERPLE